MEKESSTTASIIKATILSKAPILIRAIKLLRRLRAVLKKCLWLASRNGEIKLIRIT